MNGAFDFGFRLKQLRLKYKYTQSQVAKRIGGISSASLSSYENNINQPSIDTLARLALLYHVTTDFLMGLDNRTIIVLDDLNKRQVLSIKNIINIIQYELKLTERQAKS